MSSFEAVLDTCVLVPPTLRSTLLRAAEAGLYRARWSPTILRELEHALVAAHINGGRPKAREVIRRIQEAFEEGLITEDYMSIAEKMPIDPGDRHVLAAAVVSRSQSIVTLNTRHFTEGALRRYNIKAQTPDTFLRHLLDLDGVRMRQILLEQAYSYSNPPLTIQEMLARLARFAPGFARTVSESAWSPAEREMLKLNLEPKSKLSTQAERGPNISSENAES